MPGLHPGQTHATRKADLVLYAADTALREGMRIRGAGAAANIGFFGVTPVARQSGSIAAGLVNLGLFSSATYGTMTLSVTIQNAAYNVTATDDVVICNWASNFTVTLPAATGGGKIYWIKNINTGVVTLDGNGADTIDGSASQALYQWDGVQVVDYTANAWVVV